MFNICIFRFLKIQGPFIICLTAGPSGNARARPFYQTNHERLKPRIIFKFFFKRISQNEHLECSRWVRERGIAVIWILFQTNSRHVSKLTTVLYRRRAEYTPKNHTIVVSCFDRKKNSVEIGLEKVEIRILPYIGKWN